MQPDELKTICKKYRQKKSDPMDGDPINEYLDETGDEIAEEDLPSTNGSTEQLNRLVSGEISLHNTLYQFFRVSSGFSSS